MHWPEWYTELQKYAVNRAALHTALVTSKAIHRIQACISDLQGVAEWKFISHQ